MIRVLSSLVGRVQRSELAMRIAAGGFWIMTGAVAGKTIGLVTSVILARLLGKERLGEYGMVFSTVAMFQTFAGFGLGVTATKYVAQFRKEQPGRAAGIIRLSLNTSVVTGAFFAILLFALAPLISAETLAAPHLTGLVRISSVVLFLIAVDGAQTGILAGLESFRAMAFINTIYGVLNLVVMVCGALVAGLLGAVIALCVSQFIKFVLNRIILRKETRRAGLTGVVCRTGGLLSILWAFSLPALLSGLLVDPVGWASNALLVNQPQGYSEMGILGAASSWYAAITFVPISLTALALPVLSDLLGRGKTDQFSKVLKLKVLLFGALALVAAVPIALLSKPIMALYGASFVPGYRVLEMTAVAAVMVAILSPLSSAISSAGKMWFGLLLNSIWAVAYLGMCFWWIPEWGALGQVAARTAAYALLIALLGMLIWRTPLKAMVES
jgi:O-antigen/teichoic acid export membrane protein